MKKKLYTLLAFAAAVPLFAVTLEKSEKSWNISNDFYQVRIETAKGYYPSIVRLNGKKVVAGNILPRTALNNEREKWNGMPSRDVAQFISRRKGATGKVVSESKDKIVLEVLINGDKSNVREVITFDNTPLIKYDISVDASIRLGFHSLRLHLQNDNSEEALFYPDMKMVRSVWASPGEYSMEPTWRYVWYGKDRIGLGTVAVPHEKFATVGYGLERKKDQWQQDQANITVTHSPLGIDGVKSSSRFSYYVIAGGTPEQAQKIAESLLGKDSSIKFFSYETERLVVRPGESNKMIGDLRNTTDKAAEVTLKTTITYGLDTSKVVDTQKVKVAAGEFKKIEIPVKFPKEAERGIAIRTDVLDSKGKVLDSKLDICSVTDSAHRDSGFGIINVGQAYQDGAQDTWNNRFKKSYVGAYEYYCWAPSVIFGLVPEGEKWIPQTEHNYRSVLTRKFLKELVANAHSKGIGVYAWISGLWDYKMAMKRPDWIQYTKDGYPNLYSGMVYPNDDRRAVVKPNMFTTERAKIWAEEMADSVDMFGWDGCRWDWGFVPTASNDPLYHEDKMDTWYDVNGNSAFDLFPEPDKTGAECLRAWRDVMAKRHPKFIYGTNYSSSERSWNMNPEYHKEAARDALVLFEDMNGYASADRKTFELWGNELALRTDLVRRYNGSPVVGAMYGLPAYSVSYHLANYTCAAAGVKWWTYGGSLGLSRGPERNRYFMRFAEWYYETSYLRPAECPVEIDKGINVLYKIFARERKTAGGREVVVPIVNMPEENWNVCEFHMPPPVRKVPVKLKMKAGETAEAWLMTPQSPEKAVKLEVKDGVATVPALKDAAMVLFRCKGGK